jgi:hypothetical protein
MTARWGFLFGREASALRRVRSELLLMRPTVALFRDFGVYVVASQGKTTVSFRGPVSLARGSFCV